MAFDVRSLLAALRHGQNPKSDEIIAFCQGLADGSVSDAQAGAFAMAVCCEGLSPEATIILTQAMRDSGHILYWKTDKPILDKHSTGGIGDCVSLVLAPLLASLDVFVPMISGRGLGHTGGTLDKLEAIPDLRVDLSEAKLHAVLDQVGCAIVSASQSLAPADKRLYAIRDVTQTVDQISLITASILSKKLAAGLEGLVLDVKFGSGAFMKTHAEAKALAVSLVETAHGAGCKTSALLSDMNEPLASSVGNALEVKEALDVLQGTKQGRLRDLSLELGAELLTRNAVIEDLERALSALTQKLDNGSAAERFEQMVSLMGAADNDATSLAKSLPKAAHIAPIFASEEGFIGTWNAEALGQAVVVLGGGRLRESDQIDPSVGLSEIRPIGARVHKDEPLMMVHAASLTDFEQAQQTVLKALTLAETAPCPRALVAERVSL